MTQEVMAWSQFIIFFISVFGLFIWNRTESRQDNRHMDAKLESNRNLSLQIHRENHDILNAIKDEMRDFHNRLCSIEERNKK